MGVSYTMISRKVWIWIKTQKEAVILNVYREHEGMEKMVMNKGNEGTEEIENEKWRQHEKLKYKRYSP